MKQQRGNIIMRYMGMMFMLAFVIVAKAQNVVYVADSIETEIYFHLSKTEVDLTYMDNSRRIQTFVDAFRTLQLDSTYRISSIDVMGSASPEGYHSQNIELSQRRASAFINYLERFITLSNYVVNVTSVGSNWDGLRRMVQESMVPHKSEVLAIIDSEPRLVKWNGREADARLVQLKLLDEGIPYKYIETFIFPYLRESYIKVKCRYEKVVEETPAPEPVVEEPVVQPVQVVPAPPAEEPPAEMVELPLYRFMMANDTWKYPRYKLVFAVRENLLLPALNIGVEMPLGNRMSLAADHYYPWLWRYWPSRSNKFCYELQWEELNLKCWLGDAHSAGADNYVNRLLGCAIGAFGIFGYYDIEQDWSGHQGELWGGGVSFQYASPVGRHGRARIEYSLGVGYMYTTARTYDVFQDGGKLIHRRGDDMERSWFGPLKADITLVMPLYRRICPRYIRKEEAQ